MSVIAEPHAVPAPDAVLGATRLVVSALECTDHHLVDACRYQVAWSINPHMKIGAVDYEIAADQHASFVASLARGGVVVTELPFVHGAYDSVFVKDVALLLERRGHRLALLANLRHPERRTERAARARCFARLGYEVIDEELPHAWEGGDLVMLPSANAMFLGHGWRSHRAAAAWLERHAGVAVYPLELRDPRLYHLDMALAVLPDGTAIVCPEALAPHSLRLLELTPGVERVIHVSRGRALAFALNIFAIGDTLVLGTRDAFMRSLVTSLGYQALVVSLEQFHLAGGSAACLVAAVHRDPY